ncbi:hypothetical protein [Absidia glauca]|nr:hypothetical protein [Absidia glauca]
MEYSFVVKHLPGKDNVVADCLSRYPPSQISTENGQDDIEHLYHGLMTMDDFYDGELASIFRFLQRPWNQVYPLRIKLQAKSYYIQNGRLFKKLGE